MNHYHINVSYPYEGDFSNDGAIERIINNHSVGSGCGSWMMSFSGASEGVWRDNEFVFEDDRQPAEIIADVQAKLKAAMPDIDWRVTEMPHSHS